MKIVADATFAIGKAIVARFVMNTLRENTYIIYNRDEIIYNDNDLLSTQEHLTHINNNLCARPRHKGILIDCGARRPQEKERMLAYINLHGIALTHHLLTHGHFDHLWGAQWAADTFGPTPILPRLDLHNYLGAEQLMQKTLHRNEPLPLPANPRLIEDGQEVETAGLSLRFILVAGHTRGSAALYDADNGILFTGDTLFRDYDTIAADAGLTVEDARASARSRLLTLPKGTLCLPGHGPEFYL